jgi:hypothetical protein
MKTNKLLLATAVLAAAFGGVQAQAQSGFATPYAANDLLLSFRVNNAGTVGANDYTIDLGNVNTFLSGHAGQQFQITDFSTVATALGGDLNNVYWTAAATDGSATANIWLSSQRGASTDPSVLDSFQLDRKSNLSQGAARNNITGVGNNAALGPQLSATVVSTPDAANYSYHHFITDNGTFSYTGAGSSLTSGNGYEGATGPGFEGADSLDFYSLPSGTGKGAYLGYFELDSTGSLSWIDQASAVPEPSTFGLISLGLVALTVRRSLKAAPDSKP